MNKTFEVDEPVVTELPEMKVARMPQTVFWAPYYDSQTSPRFHDVFLPQLPPGSSPTVTCVFYDEGTAVQFQKHVAETNPECKFADPSPRPMTMRQAMAEVVRFKGLGVAVLVKEPADNVWVAERFLYVGEPLPSEFL